MSVVHCLSQSHKIILVFNNYFTLLLYNTIWWCKSRDYLEQRIKDPFTQSPDIFVFVQVKIVREAKLQSCFKFRCNCEACKADYPVLDQLDDDLKTLEIQAKTNPLK